jgi:hypothetical protein
MHKPNNTDYKGRKDRRKRINKLYRDEAEEELDQYKMLRQLICQAHHQHIPQKAVYLLENRCQYLSTHLHDKLGIPTGRLEEIDKEVKEGIH